jgi:2-methylcitrate dehydratase PrpD
MLKLQYRDLPKEAVDMAKLCIMDSLACSLTGSRTKVGEIAIKYAEELGCKPQSTIVGALKKSSPNLAAFVNALTANALDYDDTLIALGHIGATTIPAALAVGELADISGKDFITACILGYEVGSRIGLAIQPSKDRMKKVWGLGTWQTFCSVATAAKILGLTEEQIINAFGIAGGNAPVPSVHKTVLSPLGPTMVKNNYGVACEVGVMAALLAKEGFNGPADILDGDTGFWAIFGSDNFRPELLTANLGKDYLIMKNSFKPYSSCRWTHSSIEAAERIVEKNKINVKDIKKITIKTYYFAVAPPMNSKDPRNMVQAIFSTPYVVAVSLQGLKPGSSWYKEEVLFSKGVRELIEKIELVEDEEATREYPNKLISKVEVKAGSKTYSEKVEYPKGSPENPMTKEELIDKFLNLSKEILTEEKSHSLLRKIQNLENLARISELTAYLRPDSFTSK